MSNSPVDRCASPQSACCTTSRRWLDARAMRRRRTALASAPPGPRCTSNRDVVMRRLRTARVWSFRSSHPTEVPLAHPAARSQAPGDYLLNLGRGFACVLIALAPVVREPARECNALAGAAAVGALDRRHCARPPRRRAGVGSNRPVANDGVRGAGKLRESAVRRGRCFGRACRSAATAAARFPDSSGGEATGREARAPSECTDRTHHGSMPGGGRRYGARLPKK